MKLGIILMGVLGVTAIVYLAVADPGINTVPDDPWNQSNENITVTCYVESNQTAENLSANAHCPSPLKTDAEWIYIEVEACSNYTFANDEPHPCQ